MTNRRAGALAELASEAVSEEEFPPAPRTSGRRRWGEALKVARTQAGGELEGGIGREGMGRCPKFGCRLDRLGNV